MVKSNYEILGISDGASKSQIRIAFRELALKHHSDRGGHDEHFIKIKQAFEDLKTGKNFQIHKRSVKGSLSFFGVLTKKRRSEKILSFQMMWQEK